MKAASRKIIASVSLLAFFVALFSALVAGVRFETAFVRAIIALFASGTATALLALVFEKLWSD